MLFMKITNDKNELIVDIPLPVEKFDTYLKKYGFFRDNLHPAYIKLVMAEVLNDFNKDLITLDELAVIAHEFWFIILENKTHISSELASVLSDLSSEAYYSRQPQYRKKRQQIYNIYIKDFT